MEPDRIYRSMYHFGQTQLNNDRFAKTSVDSCIFLETKNNEKLLYLKVSLIKLCFPKGVVITSYKPALRSQSMHSQCFILPVLGFLILMKRVFCNPRAVIGQHSLVG